MRRLLIAFTMCLPLTGWAAGPMYIQSAKAKILEQPRFGGKTVATVVKGAPVTVIETKGRWYRVQTGEGSGWISAFLVSEQKPVDKVTVLKGKQDDALESKSRRRASAITTAGAARGLSSEDRARASRAEFANYSALEKMERFELEQNEVSTFLVEGLEQ